MSHNVSWPDRRETIVDTWSSGDAYEPYVGRWSRLVAETFVTWLAVSPGRRWLDVGCGTGALSTTVLTRASPAHLDGIDFSADYVTYARTRLDDDRATFQRADAQALPFPDDQFDAAVSGLVLNFLPDPAQGLGEMVRVTRPGGTIAVYVWDYAGEMQLMRRFWDAAIDLDPTAAALDEGQRFPLCHPAPLEQLFTATGLVDIAVRAIDIPTVFRDFDDYWSPFLGGQGPAPSYVMALDEQRRAEVRERIRAGLPRASDGSICLIARAWAGRGRVSGS